MKTNFRKPDLPVVSAFANSVILRLRDTFSYDTRNDRSRACMKSILIGHSQ